MGDEGYYSCGSDYRFTEAGAHGFYSSAEGKDIKTAKAGVENCSVVGPAAAWANQGAAAHCGAFWVGEMNECSQHITFEYTASDAEGLFYGVADVANVRDADLKVILDNPAGDEVEIFLYSVNTDNMYSYGASQHIYSLPYKTMSNGTVTIPVMNLANVEGFDPERVGGVYVKSSGSARATSIMSSCPYVININSCSAVYDKSAAKWKISTVVNNYTHAKKIEARETSSYITDGTAECDETSACTWSGISGRVGTNVLPITDANPYLGTGLRTYGFSVTLTTDDNNTLTCDTDPVEISGIEGVCGALSGSTTVKQGAGLPVFSYGISNCPDSHCGYKIILSDGAGTEIVAATESGNGSWVTYANAANKATALEVGEYHFILQSTDNPASFTSCNSATFNVTSSSVTATCNITGIFYQGQTLTMNVSNISGDVDNGGSDMTWTVTDGGSTTVTKTIKCSPSNCWDNSLTAPAAGNYTYTLTFGGRNVCSGDITIADENDEVGIACGNVSGYPGTTVENFATMSNLDNVNDNTPRVVKINNNQVGSSNNCNKNYCEPLTMTAPNSTGEYTYYVYFNNLEKCHGTLTVDPKLTCSVDKTSLTLGENFTFTASYGGNCHNSTFTGSGVSHNNCQMSYTITPTAAGTQPYNFSVTGGSIGEASCETINVDVGEPSPTVTCPTETINAEPGTTIKFTPTVTGCGSGCNYTVYWQEGSTTKKSVTNYGYTSGEISFTGDATNGINHYKFTVENKKTTENTAICNPDVTVSYQKPTYDCPADKEVAVGATVTVTPANVENCTQGCSYKVTKSSSTGTAVIGPGTGYTSGALGSGFAGESTAQTVTYYVTLSNSAGDGTACDFNVEYKDDIPVCHCATYCGSGCESNISTGNISNSNFTGCVFFTSATRINVNAADSWTINGWHENIKPSDNGCWDNPTNCANFLANHGITAVDGGYYFRGNGVWVELQTTGSDPCGGGSGGGGGGSGGGGDTPESVGSTNHRQTYTADKWYSITMHQNGKFVVQNHTGNTATLSYKDCNGTSKTKSLAAGQSGDEGGGWWNKVEDSVSKDCVIEFKYPDGGEFDMQVW